MSRGIPYFFLVFLALGLLMSNSARSEVVGTAFVMRGWGAVFLAKNLDSAVGEGLVFVNKRDMVKQAFGSNPSGSLGWTSKYGSVTFNQFGREFPLGGLNEAGLAIEGLNVQAEYPIPDSRPCLNEFQWIQYHLDTCRSVKEVLKSASSLRITKLAGGLHYLVADRKGEVAVVEFNQGKTVFHSGDNLPVAVLSNDAYAESLRYLRLHRNFGGDRVVSAGSGPGERFVRAATVLSEYSSLGQRALLDHVFVVLKSVATEETQWSIAYNIPRRMVFFKTREHRRYKIIPLGSLDFSCQNPALMLSVSTESAGNLVREMVAYRPAENQRLLDSIWRALRARREIDDTLPEDVVLQMAAYPETCRCRN